MTRTVDQHALQLQISMNDASGMRVIDSGRGLPEDGKRLWLSQVAAPQDGSQRFPRDELGDQERNGLVDTVVEEAHDARMSKLGKAGGPELEPRAIAIVERRQRPDDDRP